MPGQSAIRNFIIKPLLFATEKVLEYSIGPDKVEPQVIEEEKHENS
jgi:hypothetical protein